jgi:hypothetical protein
MFLVLVFCVHFINVLTWYTIFAIHEITIKFWIHPREKLFCWQNKNKFFVQPYAKWALRVPKTSREIQFQWSKLSSRLSCLGGKRSQRQLFSRYVKESFRGLDIQITILISISVNITERKYIYRKLREFFVFF